MKPRLWLLLALCIAGISWLYVYRILGPWNTRTRLENGFVIGQISDLYSPWVGTRELLLHRRNPYGTEVSHEIQIAFYGHVISQTYDEPKAKLADEQRFAYPIYEVFLTAPLVYMDFAEVQRWAPFVLGSLIALNVLFCLSVLQWRIRWEAGTAIILFTLSSPQIAQGLRLQQLAIVDACLLMAAAWCVSKNHFAAAGVLLAALHHKAADGTSASCAGSQFGSAGDWRKRWRVPACFIATLAALVAFGELLLPGWLGYFRSRPCCISKIRPSYLDAWHGSRQYPRRNRGRNHRSWPACICMAKSKSSGRLKAIHRSASRFFHGRLACVPAVYPIQPGAADSSRDVASARLEDSAPFFQSCFRHLHRLALDCVDRPIAVSAASRFAQSTSRYCLLSWFPLCLSSCPCC